MALPRRALLVSAALSVCLLVTGCGAGDDRDSGGSPGAVSDADIEAALAAGGRITVWAWEPTLKQVVADFQDRYPNVTVDLVNAGTGNDQYTALQNAVTARSGVPDVAQVEYYALPQFVLSKALTDLTGYGADKLEATFTPGPWTAVRSGGGVHGLPMDSGPMALFYNKEVFDKHGLRVPTTWDEYVTEAEKLHRADPNAYITSDTGDAGFATSMIWQAGGRPYRVDGTSVGIDLADQGTRTFTATWQRLIDGKLLAPIVGWSDAWYKGLSDGTIATLVIGAWMPANLESGVQAASGKWRVAPMPQWEAGGSVTAENGGSSLAIPEQGANKTLAYAFLRYATVAEGAQTRTDRGAFPATTAQLNAPQFLDKEFPYFGGQQVNQVLAESAARVSPGWSYLPFQVYANSVFGDTVGRAYQGGTTLQDGLLAWQDVSVTYGRDQGFTIR
ncbi:ABC transporter substrate-binding protein [Micromonospora craniellae]|uniref:Sugar ABC transporter substrate-binding protein n=1 Tax=Micromonospora craniellae TaxID=2294034 RepID=A0A372G0K3_9ACTN|nr:sugar ABC transporter substrate-binding protein [Micromonospora craniellae]QOC95302.1 sugar ABC transporter substrate-binding protein [Micromonospora craniellae]RFS46296.1 sugar ABC transporter substrate-binding protein [Micromonospora craniellae]